MLLADFSKEKFTSDRCQEFIKSLVESDVINEQLLGMCLRIELKYALISESDITSHLDRLSQNNEAPTFENFIKDRPICLSFKHYGEKVRYSRVVDEPTFSNYIGTFKFRNNPTIDHSIVKNKGWSTRNGIVWVTPTEEINRIWELACQSCSNTADIICDHLGFPRNDVEREYIKIDYSDDFPEETYHPNSSNRLWHYSVNLFLSYKKNDNFGRTYNENNVETAREQIHKKSYYVDENFSAMRVGTSSIKGEGNSSIIEEALNRLNG